MTKKERCPLCGSQQATFHHGDPAHFDCDVCGVFQMTFELQVDRDLQGWELHPYLSAATRKAHESGHPLVLKKDNWAQLEDEQRSIRISEKLNHLLRLIAERCKTPGQNWVIRPNVDYPLVAACNPKEFLAYLQYLEKRGFILLDSIVASDDYYCGLTIPGWQELEPMPQPGGIPGRCFVAMSFDPSLDEAYSFGIKPAIQDCGFQPVCMREIATIEGITDRILSEIRLAQFVVADFTGQRGGVYFEAGFARGLGREVVWACREDELQLVHFDIKHFGHVVWKSPAELRAKLAESIRANIIPKR